jgi:hypothetical protein
MDPEARSRRRLIDHEISIFQGHPNNLSLAHDDHDEDLQSPWAVWFPRSLADRCRTKAEYFTDRGKACPAGLGNELFENMRPETWAENAAENRFSELGRAEVQNRLRAIKLKTEHFEEEADPNDDILNTYYDYGNHYPRAWMDQAESMYRTTGQWPEFGHNPQQPYGLDWPMPRDVARHGISEDVAVDYELGSDDEWEFEIDLSDSETDTDENIDRFFDDGEDDDDDDDNNSPAEPKVPAQTKSSASTKKRSREG